MEAIDQLEFIDDEALIAMSASKLNGLIKSSGLTKEEIKKSRKIKEIRSRRRRLLNRGYASKFRESRRMEDMALEKVNEWLKKKHEDRQNYREKVVNENAGFREDLEQKKTEG